MRRSIPILNRTHLGRISFIFFLVLGANVLVPETAHGQVGTWEPIGPRGASVVAMTRVPGDPGHLYVCTFSGGLYESFDGGLSWSHLPAPFSNQYIFDITVDPALPATLYVGLFEDGVFKSTDAGESWSTANVGLTNLTIQDIEVMPATGTLLAATGLGVFYSTDAGGSWSLGSSDVEQLFSSGLFIDPVADGTAYATTTGRGIYRSIDDGQTWVPLTNGPDDQTINNLHVDTRDYQWVYASTAAGIFRISYSDFENDTGAWENISFNLNEKQIYQALTLPALGILVPTDAGVYQFNGADSWDMWADIPSRLLFATPDGSLIHVAGVLDVFAVTGDLGNTFYSASWGIQNRFVGALQTVDVFGWTVIYGGTDKGVELTSEYFRDGDTLPWILSRVFDGAIFDIAVESGTPGTFYVGTERDGVWKATDFGGQWAQTSSGMVPHRINELAQSLTGPPILYAGTSAGLYMSRDHGDTWVNEGNTTNPSDVTAVATHTATDLIAYYGTRDGQIYWTYSAGDVFLPMWPGNGEAIVDLAIAPFFNIYAVMESGQLLSSTDDGLSFFPLDGLSDEHVMAVVVDSVRPWQAYAATRTGGVYKTTARGLEWFHASSGITNPGIFCIDIAHDNENLLYAGSADVVFRSVDGAASWTPLSDGLPSGKVTRILISDIDSDVVYATVEETQVYRSTDAGQTWQLLYEELDNGEALPFFQDVSEAATLYAGSLSTGVLKSTDGGTAWTESSEGMRLFVRTLATSWDEPETVFAGSLSNGMFKSLDGGVSWHATGLEDRTIFKVAIDPNSSETVYVGSSLGIARSLDGGASWQDLGQLNDLCFDLVVDSSGPNRFYTSGLGGRIVKTLDDGQTWTRIDEDIPLTSVLAMALDESNQLLYAAPEFEGLYRSNDGGATWTQTGDELVGSQVTCLAVAPNGDLYAGTQKLGAFRSTDFGDTWAPLSVMLDSEYVAAIAISKSNPSFMYLATRSGTPGDCPVYRSTDGGSTWSASSSGIDDSSVTAFAFGDDQSTLYATTPESCYRSTDSGANWQWLAGFPAGVEVESILAYPLDADLLFAGTTAQGVLRSTDAGQSWSLMPETSGLAVSDIDLGNGGAVLAATLGNGIVRTEDLGDTWSVGADPGLLYTSVLAIALHPTDPNTVYAGTGGAGVHKTTDGGVTWYPVNTGLDHQVLLALLLDPREPNTLYAGTTVGGVYRTTDAGATWAPLNNGLFNLTITSLALDANDHTIVYAGTEGGGVFQIDL